MDMGWPESRDCLQRRARRVSYGWNASRQAGDRSRAREGADLGARLWARGGSVRPLWTLKAVADACFYVVHKQGDVLLGTVHPAP